MMISPIFLVPIVGSALQRFYGYLVCCPDSLFLFTWGCPAYLPPTNKSDLRTHQTHYSTELDANPPSQDYTFLGWEYAGREEWWKVCHNVCDSLFAIHSTGLETWSRVRRPSE
ncbi:unnamed protein product [Discosporangium mesarthrocarpum]